jgi:hypothetical protein
MYKKLILDYLWRLKKYAQTSPTENGASSFSCLIFIIMGSSFFAEFKIGGFEIFLKTHLFLLFYLKIFKITKCKKKFMEVLGTIQTTAFYIKTDFPISKNVKN